MIGDGLMPDATPLDVRVEPGQDSIDAIYRAVPEVVSAVRASLARWMRTLNVGQSVMDDVALAITEACTNVVLHAYRDGPNGSLRVVADRGPGGLRVEVTDDGCGPAPRLDSPGVGLGLPLMAALTTSLEVRPADEGHGTVVTMVFDAHRAMTNSPSDADTVDDPNAQSCRGALMRDRQAPRDDPPQVEVARTRHGTRHGPSGPKWLPDTPVGGWPLPSRPSRHAPLRHASYVNDTTGETHVTVDTTGAARMVPTPSSDRAEPFRANTKRNVGRPEHGNETQRKRAHRKRGRPNLERAHKTVTATTVAAAGAPRSGSV